MEGHYNFLPVLREPKYRIFPGLQSSPSPLGHLKQSQNWSRTFPLWHVSACVGRDSLVYMRGGESNSTLHYLSLRGRPTTKVPYWLGVSRSSEYLLAGSACWDRLNVAAHTKEAIIYSSDFQAGARPRWAIGFKRAIWKLIFWRIVSDWLNVWAWKLLQFWSLRKDEFIF